MGIEFEPRGFFVQRGRAEAVKDNCCGGSARGEKAARCMDYPNEMSAPLQERVRRTSPWFRVLTCMTNITRNLR